MGREGKAAFCSLGCISNPASCRAVSHAAQLERGFGLQICTALLQSAAISSAVLRAGSSEAWMGFRMGFLCSLAAKPAYVCMHAVWQLSLLPHSKAVGIRRLQRSLPGISSKGRQRGRGRLPLHRELVGVQLCHCAERMGLGQLGAGATRGGGTGGAARSGAGWDKLQECLPSAAAAGCPGKAWHGFCVLGEAPRGTPCHKATAQQGKTSS